MLVEVLMDAILMQWWLLQCAGGAMQYGYVPIGGRTGHLLCGDGITGSTSVLLGVLG
jgi:hypothetical protein